MYFRVVRRAVFLSIVVCSIVSSQLSALAVQNLSLTWAPSPSSGIAGYNIYFGTGSGDYTNVIPVGNVTSTTISNLVAGPTYYFAATAVNASGVESDASSEFVFSTAAAVANQPPTLNALNALNLGVNAGQQSISLSGIAAGGLSVIQALTVTASSSNTGLIPNPTITYFSPSATGTLLFTPAANATGTATITVTVNDGQAVSNLFSRTLTVTITAANVAPTVSSPSDLVINEDAGQQTINLSGISSGSVSEVQNLTVTALSGNTALIPNPTVNYTSPNAAGTLTFTPVANASGFAVITVMVNDNQPINNVFSRSFTVVVNPINDSPTLNSISDITINTNSSPKTINLSGISAGLGNEVQTLTVTASSSNTGLVPNPVITYTSPNAIGTLTLGATGSTPGSSTITVTVNDGQLQTTRTFAVNIVATNAVATNVPPVIGAIGNQTTFASTSVGPVSFNISDLETPAANLTLSATSSVPALILQGGITFGGTGTNRTVTLAPVSGQTGTANITVFVSDGEALASRTFALTVAATNIVATNLPPIISAIGNKTTFTSTSVGPVSFNISDLETSATNLTLSATSSVPSLILKSSITFSGTGTNRTVTLTPVSGQIGTANIIIAVSDGTATTSTSFQLTVQTPPPAQSMLTIVVNGPGTVTPGMNQQSLTVGNLYTINATPADGQDFNGWSGGLSSPSEQLSFIMKSNLVLQANFGPSAFNPASGNYTGLFYEDNEVRQASSGIFTLSVTTKNTYSGQLQIGASKYSFSGKIATNGPVTNSITRKGTTPLTLKLWKGDDSQTNQIFGRLTDGTWVSGLSGDRAVFNSKTKAAPYAGSYTMVFPASGTSNNYAMGFGFGTAKVDGNGKVTFAGTLSDGTTVSQSATISEGGLWPLYISLYSGKGSAIGWIAFTNTTKYSYSGLVNWIKLADSKAKLYPKGLTNETMTIGSVFTPVSGKVNTLNNTYTNLYLRTMDNKVTNSTSKVSLSFSMSNGTFKGSAKDPLTGKTLSFNGAVLQKLTTAYGLLLTTTNSAPVFVIP